MPERTTPIGQMTDVLGKLIVELAGDARVAAIAGDRVWGAYPKSDVRPAVLLRRLGPIRRFPRAAYYTGRVLIDCIGRADVDTGPQEAAALYGAVSDVLHAKGYRQSAGGLALFATYEELGGQAIEDPDTREPLERSIYIYSAPTAQAV